MILYTPLAPEQIWEGFEKNSPRLVEMEIDGVRVQMDISTPGVGVVHRIFSTDPAHYLDPRFQPGTHYRFQPVQEKTKK